MTAVRICVLTKHLLLREGLFRLLASEPSFVPLTDASAGEEPVDADIALIDSGMDDALIRCATLKAKSGARTILVGVDDDYHWCMEALRAN